MLCQAYRRQYGCDFISAMRPTSTASATISTCKRPTSSPLSLLKRTPQNLQAGTSWRCGGSGTPRRELLEVDDLADALIFLLRSYSDEGHVNVGSGTDLTIRQLAEAVMRVVGFNGRLRFDRSRPDGGASQVARHQFTSVPRLEAPHWP